MMTRTNVTVLFGFLLSIAACGPVHERDHMLVNSPPVVTSCAHEECPPCDETKQKCMGPMVCDGHPEKAKRICVRGASGTCENQLICE